MNKLDRLYTRFFEELDYQTKNQSCFPIKNSFIKSSGEYVNVLSGKLSNGTVGAKVVYVDEQKGLLESVTSLRVLGEGSLVSFDSSFLTALRSALLAVFAVKRVGRLNMPIGLIGGGKINLLTAKLLSMYGCTDITLIGGRLNAEKNAGYFSTAVGFPVKTGYQNLRKCRVLISCTNNNEPENFITKKMVPTAEIVIAQDGGYTFSRDWRMDWLNFSDYPLQLNSHFEEEFPYDKRRSFKGMLLPIMLLREETCYAGVYLYGTVVADLVIGESYLGSGKEFCDSIMGLYTNFIQETKG